jgi:hypothetical protein
MLNEMRFGQLSQRTIETFSRMSRPVTYADGLEPTVRTRRETSILLFRD